MPFSMRALFQMPTGTKIAAHRRRRPHLSTGITINFLLFLTILAPMIPSSTAASFNRLLAPRTDYRTFALPQNITNHSSDNAVDAASAVLIESLVSNQLAQLATIPAIPLPSNITKQDRIRQLVNLMPPLQTSSVTDISLLQNATEMLTALIPSTNTASNVASIAKPLRGRASTTRVMVVGDSISQGQQGDWTWRYRIWEWFRDQNIAVDFVGPYVGTMQPSPPEPPAPPPLYGAPAAPSAPLRSSGGYAVGVSPDFSSNHFAVWGRAAAVDKGLIQDVVTNHQADLMLLMLGFNDMGWFYSGPEGTLDSIYTLVTNARAANSKLKFAIANVPQRTTLGRADLPLNTDIYNALLRDAIPQWTTTESPIELVELRENYQCELNGCPAGYDGLHPNAIGEYEIAQAFSRTLVNRFQLGSSPITIPNNIPARPLPIPTNFNVVTSPGGILATWDAIYGAYGYDIRSRINNITDWSIGSVGSNRYDGTWTVDGFTYDIQVRVSCGDQLKGDWTVIGSAVAHPQTAAGPSNVVVESTATGFDITWDLPPGPYTGSITEYNIIFWDRDTPCAYLSGASFTGSPAHIDGLVSGHRYLVAPTTWNAAGGGFPETVRDVTIGGGTPQAPSGLHVIATDPTSVHLTWDETPEAAGYRIWVRNINDGSQSQAGNGTVNAACADDFFLFPGTWNYEFCISAFNGNAESPKGSCVLAPSPVSGAGPGPTCPPPPPSCPSGASSSSGGSEPTGTFAPTGPTGPSNGGLSVITVTSTGSDGRTTTIIMTLVPLTTTNVQGQTITEISVQGPSSIAPPPLGATVTTLTTVGSDGSSTLLVETLVPITTTNAQGQTFTQISIQGPSSTAPPPPGATITTLTSVGVDGRSTVLVETLVPITTTNPQGSLTTTTSVQGPIFPIKPGPPPGATITTVTTTNSNGQATVVTETLVPTTATDSRGSTVIGTKTEGPDTTIPPNTALTTFTTFPPGITWSATSVQSNTHDSQGRPVLGPWPHCWFCPPGSNGIVLSGIGPGVYPGGGPPVGLPTPFPPLTIEPNGDPDYSSQTPSTTTTSQSCTETETATQIMYYVFYDVDSSGSTTATSTYSTYSTVTEGCTVVGTTATSSETATCGTFQYDPDDPTTRPDDADNEDDPDFISAIPGAVAKLKRVPKETGWPQLKDVAGRIRIPEPPAPTPFALEKRLATTNLREYVEFGACQFPPGSTLTENVYPRVADFATPDLQGRVSQYYVVTSPQAPAGGGQCPAPYIYSTDNVAAASANAGGPAYSTVTQRGKDPWVNSDHVYEVKFLKEFMTYMLSQGNVACNDFNNFFWSNDRLKNLYTYMPGFNPGTNLDYPDFAAMDQFINGRKGQLYGSPGGFPIPGNAQKQTSSIEAYGMAAAIINNNDFVQLFQRTHQRLYLAFEGLDNQIFAAQCAGGSNVPPGSIQPVWADSYQRWMSGYLEATGNGGSSSASAAYRSLAARGIAVPQLMATYPPNSFLLRSTDMVSVTIAGALPVKRQACPSQPQPSGTTTTTTLSSTVSAATDGVTIASASPSPASPPSSSAVTTATYRFDFFNRERSGLRDIGPHVWEWQGVQITSTNYYVCTQGARVVTQTYSYTSPYPYPTSLPTFSLVASTTHSTCSYVGGQTDEVGSVTCNDGYAAQCTPYIITPTIDCTGITGQSIYAVDNWTPDFYCFYD